MLNFSYPSKVMFLLLPSKYRSFLHSAIRNAAISNRALSLLPKHINNGSRAAHLEQGF